MNALTSFSRGRRWRIALQVAVAIVAFTAIVVMVNYLSARHFTRFHWSARGSMELTPRTLALLNSMTNQVEVTLFFDSEHKLFVPVNQLLDEYLAECPSLLVRKVDLYRSPAAAQATRTRYNLPPETDDNLVIFAHGGRSRVITENQLADVDYDRVDNPDQYEVTRRYRSFRGELMFTSAIADVIAPRQLRAYFLAGHGEHDPKVTEAQMGYASFADLLAANNVQSASLSLGGAGEIPRDCDLLIVPGPKEKLLPVEIDRIEQYLNQGGRLLALFNIYPVAIGTGLERMLAQWGVVVGANLVEDEEHAQEGQAAFFTTARFGQHPIVAPLRDVRLQVMFPRTVTNVRGTAGTAGVTAAELFYSGTNAVVRTRIDKGQFEKTGRDERGEFPLAVALEKGGLPGVVSERGGVTRLVVVGDSFLFNNQLLGYLGNRDFASQVVDWLLDRSELMAGIVPRPMQEYQLALTPAQLSGVRWVLIGGLPMMALAVGLLVWLRRRN